jgi:beta-mannosidase
MTLGGEVLESGEQESHLAAQESKLVLSKSFELSREARRFTVFVCELLQPDGEGVLQRAALNVAPFAANKHLELFDPQMQVEVGQQGDQLTVDLTSSSLARFVELSLEGQDVVFSDNYFDLPAGMVVRVTCPLPAGWSLTQARLALRTRSLADSF